MLICVTLMYRPFRKLINLLHVLRFLITPSLPLTVAEHFVQHNYFMYLLSHYLLLNTYMLLKYKQVVYQFSWTMFCILTALKLSRN